MIAERELPDGRVLQVMEMTFGNHRLTISQSRDCGFYDGGW